MNLQEAIDRERWSKNNNVIHRGGRAVRVVGEEELEAHNDSLDRIGEAAKREYYSYAKKLDEEKKENAADYKARIDGKTVDARAIARVIKDGFESEPDFSSANYCFVSELMPRKEFTSRYPHATRTVEITEQRDYALRTITMFRKDTGEIAQTRPMRAEDLQEPIAFPAEDRHEGKVAYLGDSR